MIVQMHYDTAIGRIGIAASEHAVTHVLFEGETLDAQIHETPLIARARQELMEYLAGNRRSFTVPIEPEGTAFQRRVWSALLDIPFGQTRTYAQIAKHLQKPNAYRAVGHASNRNPLPIFIPCHRVIGSNGGLTGYRGGLWRKEMLLRLESAREAPKNASREC